jgi:hypothetical protein
MRYQAGEGAPQVQGKIRPGETMKYTNSTGSSIQAQGKVGVRRESKILNEERELHKLRVSSGPVEDVRS